MKIGKYIQELLLENETVIIPGFGAFLSNYKPAEINEDVDEIKPPSKEIAFNQQIRNNDGLLVGHIAESESISHFDALKEIEKERENILYHLDKGEKVTLEKTGVLFYDEKGQLQFEPCEEDNWLLDSFGLETTPLTTSAEKKEELEEKTEAPVTLTEDRFEPETEPEEKKKRSWLWILLIFVPIIVAGIFIITSGEKTTNTIGIKLEPAPKANEVEESVATLDTVKMDSLKTAQTDSSQVEEPENDTTSKEATEEARYILVGGSFTKEENAEKYLQKVKADGFKPFHLGKRGKYFIVGIGRYNTIDEASKAKSEFLKKNPDSGVWVKKE